MCRAKRCATRSWSLRVCGVSGAHCGRPAAMTPPTTRRHRPAPFATRNISSCAGCNVAAAVTEPSSMPSTVPVPRPTTASPTPTPTSATCDTLKPHHRVTAPRRQRRPRSFARRSDDAADGRSRRDVVASSAGTVTPSSSRVLPASLRHRCCLAVITRCRQRAGQLNALQRIPRSRPCPRRSALKAAPPPTAPPTATAPDRLSMGLSQSTTTDSIAATDRQERPVRQWAPRCGWCGDTPNERKSRERARRCRCR